jgi:MoxR-like ATPase
MIRALAGTLSLSFRRIQFTPDLMPSDITGTEILQQDALSGERFFKFVPGPVFANVILAAEINRTPPKTQSALLEAMQERQVTVAGKRYPLQDPFFVLATQNQIEQEGVYPLPEAQLDRFMMNVLVDYPGQDEEQEIMRRTTEPREATVEPVVSQQDVLAFQHIVRRVPIAETVARYALRLVRASRPRQADAPPFVRDWVHWGAGPRAGQFLLLGGKVRALLDGRYYVACDDLRSVAPAVLRHRIITNFYAAAEGVTSDRVVARLLESVEPYPEAAELARKLPGMF